MVKIRLKRMGRKKRPFYRIVVTDIRTKRDGRPIEEIGYYNPLLDPPDIKLDLDKVEHWIGNGAKPTKTAAYLIEEAKKREAENPQVEDETENLENEEAAREGTYDNIESERAEMDLNDDEGATSAEGLAYDMVDEAVNLENQGE